MSKWEKMNMIRRVSLYGVVALSAFGMAACDNDSGKDGKILCGEEECTEEQKCSEELQKCIPKDANCGEVVCDLSTNICTDDKKCEPKPADEDKCNAGEDKCGADGACVDILSNNDHCGACNAKCEGTCSSGTCEDNGGGGGGGGEAQCKDEEEATCDGNAVKKCEGGEYKTEACSDLEKCDGGKCVHDDTKCNPDEFEVKCENNAIVKCEGGEVKTTSCEGKVCEIVQTGEDENIKTDAVCSEKTAECSDEDAKSCTEEGLLHECVNGQWNDSSCGDNFVCGDGENGKECVAKEAECSDDASLSCDESGQIKSCENGRWKLTPCENTDEVCEGEGQCVKIEVKLCPDNDENGKQIPGSCGCAIPDTDLNNNGVVDCLEKRKNKDLDLCPDDPEKTLPGVCGCGVKDEEDGNSYKCLTSQVDYCPNDDSKTLPGVCGCNHPDTFDELTMMPWCNGYNSVDKHIYSCTKNIETNGKHLDGICGCDVPASEEKTVDDKGLPTCVKQVENICPDPDNQEPTIDSDKDGVPDCLDHCPENEFKYFDDGCSCDKVRVNIDGKEYCATPIRTADEFNKLVKGKMSNSQYDVYSLMYDIDLGEAIGHVASVEWTSTITFNGKFVSNGKKISYTNQGAPSLLKCTGTTSCGLFAGLAATARVHNIKLDFNIEGATDQTGMLAGFANAGSNISNIEAVGNVKGGKTTNSRVGGVIGYGISMTVSSVSHEGNVEGVVANGQYVGGVFGRLNGTAAAKSMVSSVSSKGDVTASGNAAGGVFGQIDVAEANDVSFSGNVKSTGANYTGGIAGVSYASLTRVVTEGKVEGRRQVGGVCGYQNQALLDVTNKAEVVANNDTLSGSIYLGGLVGYQIGGFAHEKLRNEGKVTGDCTDRDYIGENNARGKNADTCSHAGGLIGYIDNSGKGTSIKDAVNTGDLTIPYMHSGSRWGSYRHGGIVGFAYTTSIENAKNTGHISGGYETGGLVGRYDFVGNKSSKPNIDFKIIDSENTGKVDGVAPYHGGIAGYFILRDQDAKMTFSNCTNSGEISGSSYQGGIIGLFRQNGNTELIDMYSTGNVTGTDTRVGGIIGSVHPNDDWTNMQGTKVRTISLTLNRCFATGNVTGTTRVGGLIGIVDGNLHNRNLSKTGNTVRTIRCSTNNDYYKYEYDWQYLDLTNTVNMYNVYSTGKVQGTSDIGGFIGYIVGNSNKYTPTNTYYEYSTDGKCTLISTTKPAQTITRTTTLVIANAFAAGQVVSTNNSNTAAGMIGNVSYTNGMGAKYNYLFNNMYATGVVQATSGIFLGAKPNTSTVTFKNSYYWPEAGSDKVVGAGAIDIQNIFQFTYNTGVPYINDTDKLVDKLNSNFMSSTSPELNSDVSSKWFEKQFSLTDNMTVTIPMFDFGPKNNNDDNNNNDNPDDNDRP